ncbi:hypothetical protein [Haloarcula halophila]|uniref:hypothetical protein n=1 Tax=Haloarcula TaxID=2237 RepID=UPI0023E4051A|nr:hypothetical protein [Halomicroarcula sp. DFY41]
MTIATDARRKTRQRREQRADADLELPFNERVTVDCPECGEGFEVNILTSTPRQYTPTFGRCTNHECDAFLKFCWDGSTPDEPEDDDEQASLAAFAGGER